MKKNITAIVFLSSMMSGLWSFADGIEFVHDKRFQEVLDMAKAQNKVIFMDCYTVWCGPCKRLAASVFPDKEAAIF